MGEHRIHLSDDEEQQWTAYLAFHQAQMEGSFLRVLPIGEINSVDDMIAGVLAHARRLIQYWWESQQPRSPSGGSA